VPLPEQVELLARKPVERKLLRLGPPPEATGGNTPPGRQRQPTAQVSPRGDRESTGDVERGASP
jgi:hypothetical protein